jgi:hypothetical protein
MVNDHRQPQPDWAILKRHIEECVPDGACDYARRVEELAMFAHLPDNLRSTRLGKIQFESVQHIPPCLKYKPPLSLRFINAQPIFGEHMMTPLKVDALQLIQADHEHFLDLHPARYDKVKEAIALGEINMPIVTICTEGFPRVGDGRHRIIASHKMGLSAMEVLVPETESAEIARQLAEGIVRKASPLPAGKVDAGFSLEDFFNL